MLLRPKSISPIRLNLITRPRMMIPVSRWLELEATLYEIMVMVMDKWSCSRNPFGWNLFRDNRGNNGENFVSPIWGIMVHFENSNKWMVIFAKIMDGGGVAIDMEIHAIDRILVVIWNIVLYQKSIYFTRPIKHHGNPHYRDAP